MTRSALLVVLVWAQVAWAQQMYEWEDSQGLHFTDDPGSIPEHAKVTARKTQGEPLGLVSTDKGKAERKTPARKVAGPEEEAVLPIDDSFNQEEPAPNQEEPSPAEPPEEPKPNEAQWRARFRRIHQTIARLDTALTSARRQLDSGTETATVYAHGRQLLYVNTDRQRLQEQVTRLEAQRAQAQARLDALEREASFQSVPREWRQ